jgi:hypothetical protein
MFFQESRALLKNPMLLMLFISVSSLAERPIDCSGKKNQREGVIDVREFNCESATNCAVGIWAPTNLEEHAFIGFGVVQNLTGPEKYELAFSLKPQLINNEAVGYLYGTKQTLNKIRVTASYRNENKGCPLQSTVQLKHNMALNSQALPAGTPKSGAH